jgi:hypothetical protein
LRKKEICKKDLLCFENDIIWRKGQKYKTFFLHLNK